jgi:Hypoxia induced protein conserved region
MNSTVLFLLGLAMASVLATLFVGIFSMVKGGEFNKKYGNRLMRLRVVLQGVALALFAIVLLTHGK